MGLECIRIMTVLGIEEGDDLPSLTSCISFLVADEER